MSGRKLTIPEHAKIIIALHFYAEMGFRNVEPQDRLTAEYHALAREMAEGYLFVVDGECDADWLDGLMRRVHASPDQFNNDPNFMALRVDDTELFV
jgi:hypothetical protein